MGAMTRSALSLLSQMDAGDPLWWPGFCADIADGGNIPKMLEANALTWGAFSEWVNEPAHPERKERYETALAARLAHRREQVASNVMKMASVEHEILRPSDTLRAAEIVLGAGPSSGISVGVGAGGKVKIEVEFVGASGG